jgi:hypothetical protein
MLSHRAVLKACMCGMKLTRRQGMEGGGCEVSVKEARGGEPAVRKLCHVLKPCCCRQASHCLSPPPLPLHWLPCCVCLCPPCPAACVWWWVQANSSCGMTRGCSLAISPASPACPCPPRCHQPPSWTLPGRLAQVWGVVGCSVPFMCPSKPQHSLSQLPCIALSLAAASSPPPVFFSPSAPPSLSAHVVRLHPLRALPVLLLHIPCGVLRGHIYVYCISTGCCSSISSLILPLSRYAYVHLICAHHRVTDGLVHGSPTSRHPAGACAHMHIHAQLPAARVPLYIPQQYSRGVPPLSLTSSGPGSV